jgi:glyoxylate/hydroxypyruvate reductase A
VAILVKPSSRFEEWEVELRAQLPDEELWFWPDVPDPERVEYLIAWRMAVEDLASLPNLQMILCQGAGTEQWQQPGIDLPVVRLADPEMANEMAAYALAWVIRHARGFATLEEQQRRREWAIVAHKQPYDFHVGVLGYGEIGSRIARAFHALGYPVHAWTRSGRDESDIRHYAGDGELAQFLGTCDAVINALPSTPATIGLLSAERFGQFKTGSLLVNVGRGTIMDQADLVDALDRGPVAAAVLDVTDPEPPPEDSPLFAHPAITLTPHISGMTQVRSAAKLIAENVRRLRSGEAPFPVLDRTRGY